MIKQRIGLAAVPDGHYQRVHDQRCIAFRLHRPADDASGEEVKNHGHVQPAFGGSNIGEVSQPFLVWPVGGELTVKNIIGDHRTLTLVLRLGPALRARPQAVLAHQPLNPVQAAGQALFEHIASHAARAIGPVAEVLTLRHKQVPECPKSLDSVLTFDLDKPGRA